MPITGTELDTIATDTSAGAGDAAKIVLLNASGKVDDTMLPTPTTGDITGVTAGTGLTGGGSSGGVTLAADFGSTGSKICVGNDSRLSDSRTPTAHATSHASGGADAIKLDDLSAPDDNTDLNASTSFHGLLKKLSGAATQYLNGTGNFATPTQQTWYFFFTDDPHDVGQVDGDLAIILGPAPDNGKIYLFDFDAWVPIGHIVSPTVTGTWTSGSSAASGGSDGNYYLRTTTGEISLKTSGTWNIIYTLPVTLTYSTGLNLASTTLTVVYGSTSTTACVGNDSRLSDSRTPTSHATSHKSAGADSIKLDELAAPTDVTTLNVSTSAHGLTPKLPNDATKFLNGTGGYTVPPGTGTASTTIKKAGTTIGTRGAVNFIEGSNVTITTADNSGADRVDVTIASSGSGGGARDPIWDPPTTPSADDDEFTTDPLVTQGVTWTLAQEGGSSAMTRDGAVDMSQAISTGHFRSSVISSTLYIQTRQNESVLLWKQLAGALTTEQIWFVGVGFPHEIGTGSTNNPKVALSIHKNSGGGLDYGNRALVRTQTSTDRVNLLTSTSGSTVSNNDITCLPLFFIDGLWMRINHGSAAASNVGGGFFRRAGNYMAAVVGSSVQFNTSTDKIAVTLMANSSITSGGVNAVLFSVHFVRRVASTNPGFLAQP